MIDIKSQIIKPALKLEDLRVVASAEGWKLTDLHSLGFFLNRNFKYRRKITITEQSGTDLTDYQVLVELNSTNFNFEHAQTNGEDIRFTDASGNLLSYWIESWDAVNESACYSDDTEILTERGWILLKDLVEKRLKVKVATLNPITNKVEYHYPRRYFKYKYGGKMFLQEGKSINILVTPNHRMWVRRQHKTTFEFIEAGNLPKRVEYYRAFPYDGGQEVEKFVIPSVEKYKYNPHTKDIYKKETGTLEIKMDDWLRFFGIWLAEGCISESNKCYMIHISVSAKNREKQNTIIKYIEAIGFKPRYIGDNGIQISSKQLYFYLKQFGNADTKYIPPELKQLSKRQLRILLDALMLGDGCIYSKDQKKYTTSSKRLADDISEIALKCGYVSTVSKWHDRKKQKIYYNVYISQRSGTPIVNTKRDLRRWIDYDGYVYCIEVPNNIIYVRREGKSCWCGNSIWVKVPSIPASSSVEIWMYYGNPSASSASDASATFIRIIDGLVGAWHFDEGSGTTAYDTSGNDNDGTIYGATWVDGKFGKALSFDGIDDYIHRSTFTGTPGSYLTICAWIKTTIENAFILQLNRNPDNVYNELIFRISGGKLQFWDFGTSGFGFSNAQTSVGTVNTGDWKFVCFVKSTTTGKYYIDGQFDSEVSADEDVQYGSDDLCIGKDYRDDTLFFDGLIDELLFFDKALSGEEILDLYNNYGYTTENYPEKVLVRKYTEPEPSVSISEEENA